MASSRKPAKQSSGWGGFLQQAVASVESRLDTILADEDDQPASRARSGSATREAATPKRVSADLSRSDSGSKPNDRLQERLARAMAKKKSEGNTNSPASFAEPTSRAASPATFEAGQSGRVSEEPPLGGKAGEKPAILRDSSVPALSLTDEDTTAGSNITDNPGVEVTAKVPSPPQIAILPAITPTRASLDQGLSTTINDTSIAGDQQPENKDPITVPHVENLQVEHDALEKKWQEEAHSYVERIDALQSKLQYLTKEVAESAKQAAAAAKAGSTEQKIFEKDEKIALLMEEGQKLSKAEMRYLTTIKKLRSQAADNIRETSSMKDRAEKAEKNLDSMQQRTRRAEAAERLAEEMLAAASKENQNFEEVVKERNALVATVADMKSQLVRITERTEAAESKAQLDTIERGKKANEMLQDALTNAKIEHEQSEEKLRREFRDFKATADRERELAKALEQDLRSEQSVLESKLESLRSLAEESSSGTQGDAQANLLRQIETLQSQYAVASENWQGIERLLLARIANVEKERDDVGKGESDLRKKLRELTLKGKKMGGELETSRERTLDLEQSLGETRMELEKLAQKAQSAEEQLSKTRKELHELRDQSDQEIARRVEEEKAKLIVSIPQSSSYTNGSPGGPLRKGSALDLSHMILSPNSDSRPPSRRPSVLPMSNAPLRQNSSSFFRSLVHEVPETPSVHSIEHDEYFSPMPQTPASPAHTHRGVNDLISTSTIGAGPSVQLVERMSATVRRLESEKSAFKDELTRLTAQRDEARQEVVSLMREVDLKRASDERIKALEEDQRVINERYQTTLELLGEKSELVEELKADVADVKQMYRDLVVNTMK